MNRNEGEPVYADMRSHKKRYKRVLFSLGIAEIIIGSVSFILGIATVAVAASNRTYYTSYFDSFDDRFRTYYHDFYHTLTFVSQGIWCGVFAIVVGILGIRARSNQSKCMSNANMAVSIVGAVVMAALTILSGIAASTRMYPSLPSLLAIHSALALLGFAGLVVMIIHSAYCCAGVCSKANQEVPVSYHPSSTGVQQPQFIQLGNGQYVPAPGQSTVPPYSAAQIPVTYHPPLQGVTAAQIPTNQSYHVANLGSQIVLVPSNIQVAPPQAIDSSPPMANVIANPQEADPTEKNEANEFS